MMNTTTTASFEITRNETIRVSHSFESDGTGSRESGMNAVMDGPRLGEHDNIITWINTFSLGNRRCQSLKDLGNPFYISQVLHEISPLHFHEYEAQEVEILHEDENTQFTKWTELLDNLQHYYEIVLHCNTIPEEHRFINIIDVTAIITQRSSTEIIGIVELVIGCIFSSKNQEKLVQNIMSLSNDVQKQLMVMMQGVMERYGIYSHISSEEDGNDLSTIPSGLQIDHEEDTCNGEQSQENLICENDIHNNGSEDSLGTPPRSRSPILSCEITQLVNTIPFSTISESIFDDAISESDEAPWFQSSNDSSLLNSPVSTPRGSQYDVCSTDDSTLKKIKAYKSSPASGLLFESSNSRSSIEVMHENEKFRHKLHRMQREMGYLQIENMDLRDENAILARQVSQSLDYMYASVDSVGREGILTHHEEAQIEGESLSDEIRGKENYLSINLEGLSAKDMSGLLTPLRKGFNNSTLVSCATPALHIHQSPSTSPSRQLILQQLEETKQELEHFKKKVKDLSVVMEENRDLRDDIDVLRAETLELKQLRVQNEKYKKKLQEGLNQRKTIRQLEKTVEMYLERNLNLEKEISSLQRSQQQSQHLRIQIQDLADEKAYLNSQILEKDRRISELDSHIEMMKGELECIRNRLELSQRGSKIASHTRRDRLIPAVAAAPDTLTTHSHTNSAALDTPSSNEITNDEEIGHGSEAFPLSTMSIRRPDNSTTNFQIQKLEKENLQLKELINDHEAQKSHTETLLTSALSRESSLREQLENLRSEQRKQASDNDRTREDMLMAIDKSRQNLLEQQEIWTEERRNMQGEIETLWDNLREKESALESTVDERNSLQKEVEQLREKEKDVLKIREEEAQDLKEKSKRYLLEQQEIWVEEQKSMRNEMETLRDNLNSKGVDLESVSSERDSLQKEAGHLRDELQAELAASNSKDKEIQELREQLKQQLLEQRDSWIEEQKSMQNEMETLRDNLNRKEVDLESISSERDSLQKEVEQLREVEKEVLKIKDREIQELSDQLERQMLEQREMWTEEQRSMRDEILMLQNNLNRKETELETTGSERNSLQKEVDQLREELRKELATLNDRVEEIQELKEQREMWTEEQKSIQNEIETLSDNLNRKETDLESVISERDSLQKQVVQLRDELRTELATSKIKDKEIQGWKEQFEQELEEFKSEYSSEWENRYNELSRVYEACREELYTIQQQLQNIQQEEKINQEQIQRLLQRQKDKQNIYKEQNKALKKEMVLLKSKYQKLQKLFLLSDKDVGENTIESGTQLERLLRTRIEELEKEVQILEKKLNDQQREFTKTVQQLQADLGDNRSVKGTVLHRIGFHLSSDILVNSPKRNDCMTQQTALSQSYVSVNSLKSTTCKEEQEDALSISRLSIDTSISVSSEKSVEHKSDTTIADTEALRFWRRASLCGNRNNTNGNGVINVGQANTRRRRGSGSTTLSKVELAGASTYATRPITKTPLLNRDFSKQEFSTLLS